jgi:uncharacterized protein (TIGR03790 family)
MGTLLRGVCYIGLVAFFLSMVVPAFGAVSPENVLVLYNLDSTEGPAIAAHYAQAHPGVNVLGLSGVTTAEQVTADYYLDTIRPQILPVLNSSITTIVTTKGLPLRIEVTENNPTSYVDPFNVTRTVESGYWKTYSSLESELTRINVISTWQQMGDQTYFNTPCANNPYYLPTFNPRTIQYEARSAPFDYNAYYIPGFGGMRLTARLDGFTTADINASIDRAQQAYLLPGSSSQFVIMDDDPNSLGGDRISNLKKVLDSKPQAYVYNTDDNAVTTASRRVIGYVSHGTNDGTGGLPEGYMNPNVEGHLAFNLANGAVFETHESYNAFTFNQDMAAKIDRREPVAPQKLPPDEWYIILPDQGLVAEWLAVGGTAGVGNVWEPQSGRTTEANEDQIFKMLLDGYTWGEAAWSSMQQLSYVNTVIGDPLMTWKQVLLGDANLDGRVDVADLSLLGAYWGTTGQSGGYMWSYGDFNGDGVIDVADLSLLGAYWGQTAGWAQNGVQNAGPLDAAAFLQSVPEPSVLISILTGIVAFLAIFRHRMS